MYMYPSDTATSLFVDDEYEGEIDYPADDSTNWARIGVSIKLVKLVREWYYSG